MAEIVAEFGLCTKHHFCMRIHDQNNCLSDEFVMHFIGHAFPANRSVLANFAFITMIKNLINMMHNMREQSRIRVKVFLPQEDPSVPTVTDLFSAANWMERETYDFYGISFIGHPNLIRILNVEYLDYFPMRKEYPLEDPTREDKDNRFFGRED